MALRRFRRVCDAIGIGNVRICGHGSYGSGVPVVAVAAGGLLDIMTNCAGNAGELYPSGLQSRRVDRKFY